MTKKSKLTPYDPSCDLAPPVSTIKKASLEHAATVPRKRCKRGTVSLEDTRKRNKLHAKSSRARKKVFVEGLQVEVRTLREVTTR
jgi:hypothetical protein